MITKHILSPEKRQAYKLALELLLTDHSLLNKHGGCGLCMYLRQTCEPTEELPTESYTYVSKIQYYNPNYKGPSGEYGVMTPNRIHLTKLLIKDLS